MTDPESDDGTIDQHIEIVDRKINRVHVNSNNGYFIQIIEIYKILI